MESAERYWLRRGLGKWKHSETHSYSNQVNWAIRCQIYCTINQLSFGYKNMSDRIWPNQWKAVMSRKIVWIPVTVKFANDSKKSTSICVHISFYHYISLSAKLTLITAFELVVVALHTGTWWPERYDKVQDRWVYNIVQARNFTNKSTCPLTLQIRNRKEHIYFFLSIFLLIT
jgi:hypothetical protein